MGIIPTKIHGIIDYILGIILLLSPLFIGFNMEALGPETAVPVILGAGVILYSAFTNYELGAFKRLSMKTHLWLDVLGGIVLIASPWIFNFAELVFWPFVILGGVEVLVAILSKSTSPTNEETVTKKGI